VLFGNCAATGIDNQARASPPSAIHNVLIRPDPYRL
jgi:hypothetical protein